MVREHGHKSRASAWTVVRGWLLKRGLCQSKRKEERSREPTDSLEDKISNFRILLISTSLLWLGIMGEDEVDPVWWSCVPRTQSLSAIFHGFFLLGVRLELCISQRKRAIAR